MSESAPNNERNRQILSAIVRAYIETGEPVSSRSISRRHVESLSPATIRNVMSDLEEQGFLYQPHTSAGRVPTASAYRFFAQQIVARATLSPEDEDRIRGEFAAAGSGEEIAERAGHVLAEISKGLGIVVSPPISKTVLEHIRFVLLPDGRIVVVLVSTGGNTRDKVIRPEQAFSQQDLDHTAEYLNHHYTGFLLEAIRADLLMRLAKEEEQYALLARNALVLCDPGMLGQGSAQRVYIEGAAQMAAAPEFTDQAQLRDVPRGDRGKAQDHRPARELHRYAGPRARTNWRQGNGPRGRTLGIDQRAVFVPGSIAGNGRRPRSHAHAV